MKLRIAALGHLALLAIWALAGLPAWAQTRLTVHTTFGSWGLQPVTPMGQPTLRVLRDGAPLIDPLPWPLGPETPVPMLPGCTYELLWDTPPSAQGPVAFALKDSGPAGPDGAGSCQAYLVAAPGLAEPWSLVITSPDGTVTRAQFESRLGLLAHETLWLFGTSYRSLAEAKAFDLEALMACTVAAAASSFGLPSGSAQGAQAGQPPAGAAATRTALPAPPFLEREPGLLGPDPSLKTLDRNGPEARKRKPEREPDGALPAKRARTGPSSRVLQAETAADHSDPESEPEPKPGRGQDRLETGMGMAIRVDNPTGVSWTLQGTLRRDVPVEVTLASPRRVYPTVWAAEKGPSAFEVEAGTSARLVLSSRANRFAPPAGGERSLRSFQLFPTGQAPEAGVAFTVAGVRGRRKADPRHPDGPGKRRTEPRIQLVDPDRAQARVVLEDQQARLTLLEPVSGPDGAGSGSRSRPTRLVIHNDSADTYTFRCAALAAAIRIRWSGQGPRGGRGQADLEPGRDRTQDLPPRSLVTVVPAGDGPWFRLPFSLAVAGSADEPEPVPFLWEADGDTADPAPAPRLSSSWPVLPMDMAFEGTQALRIGDPLR